MADDVEQIVTLDTFVEQWRTARGREFAESLVAENATLRADLAKAVEGLERIDGELEASLCAHNWSFSLGHVHAAQSLIKELRP